MWLTVPILCMIFQQLFPTQMKWDSLVPSCAWSFNTCFPRQICQFNPLEMGLTGSILCVSFQHVSNGSYCQINPIQMRLTGSIPYLVLQQLFPTTITARLTHFNWDLLIWTLLFPAADAARLTKWNCTFWFHPLLGFSTFLSPTDYIAILTHLKWDILVPSCAWSFATSFSTISHW